MAYKYTYPVVDRALRNFLVFVLVLLAVVTIAAAIGTVSGVDTATIETQTMGFSGHATEHIPTSTIQDTGDKSPMSGVSASGIQMFLDAYAES